MTQKAKAAGMLVICCSVEEVHGFAFHGLGRPVTANPDDFNVYEPGSWWAQSYYGGEGFYSEPNRLLVPMDARTTASPTGPGEYVFYAQGGWSWSIPYIAGAYALDIDKATRKDVIEQLGKPSFYALGNEMLDANDLPNQYAMVYRGSVPHS